MENWERARRYNEEVESCSEEKAFRLKAFQKEVKMRVRNIEKEKQSLLVARSQKDVWVYRIECLVKLIEMWSDET